MLTVHHLSISQSDRIVWLCEELEIPYQLVRYEREPADGRAPPPYRAMHPIGMAPIITDGGFVLSESGAIIDYIIARYGGGRLAVAPDSPHFADYLYWYHFANATLQPAAIVDLVIQTAGTGKDGKLEALRERLPRANAFTDQRLGEADYFAGPNFTAADIMMVFNLTTLRRLIPIDLAPYANIRAYLARIGRRAAYQRAMLKAEPDLAPLST